MRMAAGAGMMMAPRPPYPMPGMPYQGGMLMPQSVPLAQPLGVKVRSCWAAWGLMCAWSLHRFGCACSRTASCGACACAQAEDLGEAEGTGRSDQLGGGDADMGIAGLSLPAGSGIIDGLGGMSAAQPFTSVDSLGMHSLLPPAPAC